MTKYIATAPDGNKVIRKSDRTYTHAVIVQEQDGTWLASFNSRRDLAEKVAAKDRLNNRWAQVHVVEVTVQVPVKIAKQVAA